MQVSTDHQLTLIKFLYFNLLKIAAEHIFKQIPKLSPYSALIDFLGLSTTAMLTGVTTPNVSTMFSPSSLQTGQWKRNAKQVHGSHSTNTFHETLLGRFDPNLISDTTKRSKLVSSLFQLGLIRLIRSLAEHNR